MTDNNINTHEIDYKKHWDKAYVMKPTEELGWYEKRSQQTLDLIEKTGLPKDAKILNVGSGSSTLIDDLLSMGYSNLIAADISAKALEVTKQRLNSNAGNVQFIQDDLTNPKKLNELENIDLWNDRAVLHFFRKEEEICSYFNLLKKLLKKDGYAIIATFALHGAEKCCDLTLRRYNTEMIQERLGKDFELIENFDFTYINPRGGERPYVYTLFKRFK